MADNKINIIMTASDMASTVMGKVVRQFEDMNAQADKTTRKFTEMNSVISSLAGAVSLAGVAALTKDLIQAGMGLDRLNRQFATVTGSASLGARELEFVRQTANKLGSDVIGLSGAYARYLTAVKGTAMEGEAARRTFVGITEGMTAIGMSAADQTGAWVQLAQGIMKGKFEMEDLKSINERGLPVFKMLADALGVSTEKLMQMQKEGKVLAVDVMPKLGDAMHKTFGVAASEGAKSAQAEIARFDNAVVDLKATLGATLLPVLSETLQGMQAIVKNGLAPMVAGIVSVQAEIIRMGMLLDKAGGTMTTANFAGWKAAELTTRFVTVGQFGDTFKKQADFSSQLNKNYEDRYRASEKRLEELAKLEQRLLNPLSATDYTAAEKAAAVLREKAAAAQAAAAKAAENAKAIEREREAYVKLYNSLQDKRSENDPTITKEQKELTKLRNEYDNYIATFPRYRAELEENYRRDKQNLEIKHAQIRAEKEWAQAQALTGAMQARASFGVTSFNYTGGQTLQIPADRYRSTNSGSLSLMKPQQSGIDASRYSLLNEGAGKDPARWNVSDDEVKRLEQEKQQMLAIEERYNTQLMGMKMQFAEQSLGLLAETAAEGSAIQIAALVAMKALAVAQIIMNAHAAASAALLPPPVGLGPIAGQAMAAQILGMGYANAAITGAVGIMQIANSVTGKREFGGPVVAGKSYLVGEKRPEIFTPNQSGWITPRADAGGGLIIQQNFSITGVGADIEANTRRIADQAGKRAKAEILNSMNRGSEYSRAVGRA